MDALVRGRSARFHGRELSGGAMAEAQCFRHNPGHRHSAEPDVARDVQVPPGSGRTHSAVVAAEVFASGAAPGTFILDFPGDELPVRSLSRRGTGSILVRVCPVHGIFSGDDLRANLPPARYVAAIPF